MRDEKKVLEDRKVRDDRRVEKKRMEDGNFLRIRGLLDIADKAKQWPKLKAIETEALDELHDLAIEATDRLDDNTAAQEKLDAEFKAKADADAKAKADAEEKANLNQKAVNVKSNVRERADVA